MKMKKKLGATLAMALAAATASAAASNNDGCDRRGYCDTVARFGIITDIHHTNKADILDRKYSASLEKTAYFVKAMNRARADFVIELGDYVDTLVDGKDPVTNLGEIERIFTRFRGPAYHVLGNHDFDNMTRADFLGNVTNTGIASGETYYSFDLNGIHCIVLDADYTNAEPHRPFDYPNVGSWWNWKDAWIPRDELDWLTSDLAAANLPTVVFTHQLMHRDTTEDHTIKNADEVRAILESDGQVIAVFSGHDHRGEVAFRNGIHYLVLEGNVGVSLDWSQVSATEGLDPVKDSPYTFVEIAEQSRRRFNGMKTYRVTLTGNAQQYSFEDQVQIVAP